VALLRDSSLGSTSCQTKSKHLTLRITAGLDIAKGVSSSCSIGCGAFTASAAAGPSAESVVAAARLKALLSAAVARVSLGSFFFAASVLAALFLPLWPLRPVLAGDAFCSFSAEPVSLTSATFFLESSQHFRAAPFAAQALRLDLASST